MRISFSFLIFDDVSVLVQEKRRWKVVLVTLYEFSGVQSIHERPLKFLPTETTCLVTTNCKCHDRVETFV